MRNASHPEPESGSEALKAIYPNASRGWGKQRGE